MPKDSRKKPEHPASKGTAKDAAGTAARNESLQPKDVVKTEDTSEEFSTCTIDADLKEGTHIDRYQILGLIGKGGMGAVYKAYDPELDRSIAIKILTVKPHEGETASRPQARLMREAQALAKLSHPNVVSIFDVGTYDESVYIAMEYVKGKTLRDWLKDEQQQKEIIKVLLKAGKGIQAAHAEGIIHRDFKPENVIVGDRGQIKVLDFGLARVSENKVPIAAHTKPSSLQKPTSGEKLLSTRLTQVGAKIGTTVYMAPEHFEFQKLDEKTDQFSFCVTLFEALYGKRPFFGFTSLEFEENVIKGRVRIPEGAGIPKWIRDIILKGLSVSKKDRYHSMVELLDALQYDPGEAAKKRKAARNRTLLVVSLVILTIVLPIGVWYGLRYRIVQLCMDAESEFGGVWDDATKADIRKAFLGTKKSYAQGTWERVELIFNDYKTDWMQMRSDICEARLVRGTQSEEIFDLRMRCLLKRKGELGALAKIFAKADDGVIKNAVHASSSLTGIMVCADEEALRAHYPPPKTAEAKEKVAAIREKLAEVEAFEKTGKYQEGLALGRKLEKEANAIDYRPVQAEVFFALGGLLERLGEYDTAEDTLHEAAQAAGESRDGLLAAKALSRLVWVVGYYQARHEAGLLLARSAKVVLGVAGQDDDILSTLLGSMGVVLWAKGFYDKALEHFCKALVIQEKLLGPEHPHVARTLGNIGLVFDDQGKYDKALEYYRKALAILQKALGSEHPHVARMLNNMGNVFGNQGEYDKALEYHRRALAIRVKALGPEHPHVARTLGNIGLVFDNQGEHDNALEYLSRALAIFETALGQEHPMVATALNNLGSLYSRQGKYDKALRYYSRSLAIQEKALGVEHPSLAEVLSRMGSAFLDGGMQRRALKFFERVVRLCEKKSCDPGPYGQGLFGLAQALVATGGDKGRAISLAKQAREIFEKTPKAFKKKLDEVDAWLKKHDRSKALSKAKR